MTTNTFSTEKLRESFAEDFSIEFRKGELWDWENEQNPEIIARWWLSKFKEYQSHLVLQLEGEKNKLGDSLLDQGFILGRKETLDTAISIINKSME